MKWHFPKVRFVHTNTPVKQLNHLLSEADEILGELVEQDGINRKLKDIIDHDKVDAEVSDLLHSCETYFRIREREGADLAQLFAKVTEKNKKRGYYETQDCNTCKRMGYDGKCETFTSKPDSCWAWTDDKSWRKRIKPEIEAYRQAKREPARG